MINATITNVLKRVFYFKSYMYVKTKIDYVH